MSGYIIPQSGESRNICQGEEHQVSGFSNPCQGEGHQVSGFRDNLSGGGAAGVRFHPG